MPLVQITLARGRTEEQLTALGREVTDAVERSLGARRESIRVGVSECEPEHWFAAGGERAGVFGVAGEYYVSDAQCPHRNGPLVDGWVREEDRMLICPWHWFRFDL